MRSIIQYPLFACLAIGLTACGSMTSSDKIDYKKSGQVSGPNLALPPDLITTQAERRFVVQDGTATMSEYNQAVKKSSQMRSNVLTGIPGMKIERDGDRRWLVVDKPATELYPQVKDFWQENGFLLAIDSPSTGIMETDWAENRAKLPQDFIRRSIGKVLDSLYSTGERDKFRISLERTADNKTEIYISHRGLIEVYSDTLARKTVWQPRPSDPELEKEFLRRLMIQLDPTLAANDKLAEAAAPSKTSASSLISVDGSPAVLFNQGFDITWRRVGVTLDRNGFTVEDRDRKIGMYFVRYVEVNADGEPGFFSRIFSKATPVKEPQQFRIKIDSNPEQQSTISILNASGKPDGSETAKKIAQLLVNELQ